MARHEATGSRLGYTGVLEVTSIDGNRDGRGPSLSGADYYDERYWRSIQPTAKDAAWAADDDTHGATNGHGRAHRHLHPGHRPDAGRTPGSNPPAPGTNPVRPGDGQHGRPTCMERMGQ